MIDFGRGRLYPEFRNIKMKCKKMCEKLRFVVKCFCVLSNHTTKKYQLDLNIASFCNKNFKMLRFDKRFIVPDR